jgi:hypothetical protein
LKTEIKLLVPLLLAFLVLTQGCEPKSSSTKKSSFSPTQNGFGVVVHEIGIDSGPDAKLYYKGTNERPALVWPSIGTHGYPLLYTNDIVFLLADKPNEQGIGGGVFIVVQGTGPAMDITADVLKIIAEQMSVDFKKSLQVCRPLRLIQTGEKMKVVYLANPLVDPSIPDLEGQINWEQVFAIMQDVKKTGKTNKVVNKDVLYLQKDYDSK